MSLQQNHAVSEVLLSTFDEAALIQKVESCRERSGGRADIIFAFVTADWRPHLKDLTEILQVYGRAPRVIGCSSDGLIGTGEENENVSGVSLLFLNLPGADINVKTITAENLKGSRGQDFWHQHTGVNADETGGWITLANPSTFDGETWLREWNSAYPGIPTYGGLASGGRAPEDFFLFHGGEINEADSIAVSFGGGIKLEGIVSQGCRPIGEPYTITSVDDNVILTIASKSAYKMLEEAFESLGTDEREHAQGNIFAGLATSEYLENFGRGDFLVRNILGGDRDAGAIALGAFPRVGQTLQFQMRDRDAADEDIRILAESLKERSPRPLAGLLFSCTGRGSRMFDIPNHDASILEETLGSVPTAGFFCNGEIGPVGSSNFLHGYTAAAAFFVEA